MCRSRSPARDVAVSGNYAYVGAACRFQVADISDPFNPVEVGKALKMLGFRQGQRRGHGTQRFPVKGYYIYKNPPTTYYNEDK